MEIKLQLAAGDSRHTSRDVSSQARVNLIPERQDYAGATEEWVLLQAPGCVDYLASGASGTCRGLHTASNGSLYGVWGDAVVELREVAGTVTAYARGTLATSGSPVTICDDGVHCIIADGSGMWSHELDTSDDIAAVSLPFQGPAYVVALASRIVCIATAGTLEDRQRIWWSDLADALGWDALSYATAEGVGDPLSALVVRRGELWAIGTDSYEVWGVTGDANLPFARVGAAQAGFGCSAPYSAVEIGGEVLWVGGSRAGADAVLMSNGYGVQRVSDVTISQAIAAGDLADAVGWSYQAEGHAFYMLTLPGAGTALCYDLTTGKWSRRESKADDGSFEAWGCRFAARAFGRTLCGFRAAGMVVELTSDAYTDADGRPIVRTYRSNQVIANGHPLMCRELRAVYDCGRASLGDDPQAMMRYSNDGGYTWSNADWRSIGVTGAYSQPVSWLALGSAREWMFELQVSSAARTTLVGLYADMQQGGAR